MQLSQTAEYALRAMACMASLPPGKAARADEVSEATGIPVAYVSKILRRMVVAGLLDSRKGHGGGFTLTRPPATVRFKDVLEAVDYPIGGDRCAFGWGACDPRNPCPLHGAWSELARGFSDWAEKRTLAGLPPPPAARRRLPAAKAPGRRPRKEAR